MQTISTGFLIVYKYIYIKKRKELGEQRQLAMAPKQAMQLNIQIYQQMGATSTW